VSKGADFINARFFLKARMHWPKKLFDSSSGSSWKISALPFLLKNFSKAFATFFVFPEYE
jgi:hypothetical protein